jgi:hypothetical protein
MAASTSRRETGSAFAATRPSNMNRKRPVILQVMGLDE